MKRVATLVATTIAISWSSALLAGAEKYAIKTYKNGQMIGTREVTSDELKNSALALTAAFQDRRPPYSRLLEVALSLPAKDRCFNLFASRATLASVQAGLLDASANAESFLRDSVASIEEVNKQTGVTCEMR